MKSFSSNRTVNNYESVEYTLPPPPPNLQPVPPPNPNTADIYYHENNDIYLDDDDGSSDEPAHPRAPPGLVLSAAALMPDPPHYLTLQPPAPPLPKRADLTLPGPARGHYLRPATLQQPRAHNNYSTNSLINVKYIIDLDDLKGRLHAADALSQRTTHTTVLDQPSGGHQTPADYARPPQLVVKCGCVRSCIALLSFLVNFLSCLTSAVSNCCCKPCCSTAAMLGGVGALGGVMAGAAALGVLGIIPIPVEIARNICHMQTERVYNQSLVFADAGFGNSSLAVPSPGFAGVANVSVPLAPGPVVDKAGEQAEFVEELRNRREKAVEAKLRRMEEERREEGGGSLVRPLQYDVTLYPGGEVARGIEMKALVSVRFVCRNWTSQLVFGTREFASIEMGFEKAGSVAVQKWSFDSATGRLSVAASEAFTPNRVYVFSFFVVYKNYGRMAGQPQTEP